MGKQEGESRWWAHSKSSTVLLDPAAFVETWKRQIQGKDGLPIAQQRLTFACPVTHQELEEGPLLRSKGGTCGDRLGHQAAAAADLIKDLKTWQAILRCNNKIVGSLKNPSVVAESEQSDSRLYCQTAHELRDIGIPCDVFYLSFDKWIPAVGQLGTTPKVTSKGNKNPIKLFLEIEKYSNYRIDLIGHLEGIREALLFGYQMNGTEVHAQLSMLQQKEQYRQSQQVHHRRGLRSQTVGKGLVGRDDEFLADHNGHSHSIFLTREQQDHFIPCGKDEFTAVVSNEAAGLKCVVLKVISVPVDTRKKFEQLVSPVSSCQLEQERKSGSPNSPENHSELFCLSPSHLDLDKCAEQAHRSSQKTSLNRSRVQRGLKDQTVGAQSAKRVREFQLTEQQHPVATSQELETSSLGPVTGVEFVCESSEAAGPRLPSRKGSSTKLSKKKKKKKKRGRRKNNTATVEDGESLVPKPAEEPVLPDPTCANALPTITKNEGITRMQPADPSCSEASMNEDIKDMYHVSNIGKGLPSSRSIRTSSQFTDKDCSLAETNTDCAEEVDTKLCSQQRCWGARYAYWKRKLLDGAIESPGACSDYDGTRGHTCYTRSGKAKAEKELHNGLLKAAAYCVKSGRLAPYEFLKEVYSSTGMLEKFPALMCIDSYQHDLAAGKDCVSRVGRNEGSVALLSSSRSGKTSETLVCTELQRSSEYLQDMKVSVCGHHNTGASDAATPKSNGSKVYTRVSDDHRGGCTQLNVRSSQGSEPDNSVGFCFGGGNCGIGKGGRSSGSDVGVDRDYQREEHCEGRTGMGNKERMGPGEVDGHPKDINVFGSELYSQRRKTSSSSSDHRVWQIANNGVANIPLNGHGYGAVASTPNISPIGKENKHTVWKVKQNLHEDEALVVDEPIHLPTGVSSEANTCEESHHQAQCHSTATTGSNFEVTLPSKPVATAVYSNGSLTSESPVSKETTSTNSHQNPRRKENSHPLEASNCKAVASSDSSPKSEQNIGIVASDFAISNGGIPSQQRLRELSLPGGAINHSQESGKATWVKKENLFFSGNNKQQLFALKGTPEVPYPSDHVRGGKNVAVPPLNDHLLQHNPVTNKDSNTLHIPPPNVTLSAHHNTPCSHPSKAEVSNLAESSSTAYLDSSAASAMPRHRNGVAASSQSSLEESTQRWRGGRQIITEQDRKVFEKCGGDKESAAVMSPTQKWVPVDKGAAGARKLQGSSEQRSMGGTPAPVVHASSCNNVKDTEKTTSQGETKMKGASSCKGPQREGNNLHEIVDLELPKPQALAQVKLSSAEGIAHLGENLGESGKVKLKSVPLHRVPLESLQLHRITKQGYDNERLGSTETVGSGSSSPVIGRIVDFRTEQLISLLRDAIQVSSQGRQASEEAATKIGAPIAEFERVLHAVAPTVPQEAKEIPSGPPSSSCDFTTGWCCRAPGSSQECQCRVPSVPLSAVWQWYLEPSNYGVEVKAHDLLRNRDEEKNFLAYFVPYLSGVQLFTLKGCRPKKVGMVGKEELATPSPKLGKNDFPETSDLPPMQSRHTDQETSAHLVYEFFEQDPPSQRLPLLQKVQELIEGGPSTSGLSYGDPSILGSAFIHDLHPASWFAVAWYPIYRISDGPLRSVFLTYHSLGHCIPGDKKLGQYAGLLQEGLSFPVVGLESYNTQLEGWLSLGPIARSQSDQSRTEGNAVLDSTLILKQRLQSLQAGAAAMAKGLSTTNPGSKHLDYEFFVSRRR